MRNVEVMLTAELVTFRDYSHFSCQIIHRLYLLDAFGRYWFNALFNE